MREGPLASCLDIAYIVVMAAANASVWLATNAPKCRAAVKDTAIGSENGSQILSFG